jgi:hypothetical protein
MPAYNLNSMRSLVMPKMAEAWSLTSLRKKLIKIGAKVDSHGLHIIFQMVEIAIRRQMLREILSVMARLRAPPRTNVRGPGINTTGNEG